MKITAFTQIFITIIFSIILIGCGGGETNIPGENVGEETVKQKLRTLQIQIDPKKMKSLSSQNFQKNYNPFETIQREGTKLSWIGIQNAKFAFADTSPNDVIRMTLNYSIGGIIQNIDPILLIRGDNDIFYVGITVEADKDIQLEASAFDVNKKLIYYGSTIIIASQTSDEDNLYGIPVSQVGETTYTIPLISLNIPSIEYSTTEELELTITGNMGTRIYFDISCVNLENTDNIGVFETPAGYTTINEDNISTVLLRYTAPDSIESLVCSLVTKEKDSITTVTTLIHVEISQLKIDGYFYTIFPPTPDGIGLNYSVQNNSLNFKDTTFYDNNVSYEWSFGAEPSPQIPGTQTNGSLINQNTETVSIVGYDESLAMTICLKVTDLENENGSKYCIVIPSNSLGGIIQAAKDSVVTLSWSIPNLRTDGSPLLLSQIESFDIKITTNSAKSIIRIESVDGNNTKINYSKAFLDNLFFGTMQTGPIQYDFNILTIDIDGLKSSWSPLVSKKLS